MQTYPSRPAEGRTLTSNAAATLIAKVSAKLEKRVLEALAATEMTNSELADHLKHTPSGVQPRTSELRAKDLVYDTGKRRQNRWGNNEIVWALVPF